MKILILGSLPPPVGGVTSSVRNLVAALRSVGETAEVVRLSALFRRWDIAHVHFTRPWKRFLGVVAGRLLAKRLFFTIHNGRVEHLGVLDRLSIRLAHRVILLNRDVHSVARDRYCGDKAILLSNYYREGLGEGSGPSVTLSPGRKHALVYVYDRWLHDGRDVYGIEFVLENLAALPDDWTLVLVDPKGLYREDAMKYAGRVQHLNGPVNFLQVLKDVDLYLRPTSTDGASIAVQEALCLGTPVVASDAAPRSDTVQTYAWGDAEDYSQAIARAIGGNTNAYEQTGVVEYLTACRDAWA